MSLASTFFSLSHGDIFTGSGSVPVRIHPHKEKCAHNESSQKGNLPDMSSPSVPRISEQERVLFLLCCDTGVETLSRKWQMQLGTWFSTQRIFQLGRTT